jgi:hypothetical protein
MSKAQDKGRILKSVRKNHGVTFKGKSIRPPADYSPETLEARRAWNNVF